MQRYEENLVSKVNGVLQPLLGVSVTVTDENDLSAALYSDNGVTPLLQPLTTDANGYFGFYAANGSYIVTGRGAQIGTITRKVELYDPADAPPATLSDLAAPTGASKIGVGSETVENALNALQLADYTALRAYAGPRKSVYVTGYLGTAAPSGIAGMFVRDDSDTTSSDNGGTIIVGSNGERWKRVYSGAVNTAWFGTLGDGTSDDTAALTAVKTASVRHVELPPATYSAKTFPVLTGVVYRGLGNAVLNFFDTATSVKVAAQNNTRFEGIVFNSTVASLPWQRVAVDDATNVLFRNCAFKGFQDASAAPNAWGVLIQRANNIVLDNCEFASNSQSDIAITDTVRDVTVINPRNSTDNGVLLNIEPNGTDGIVGGNFLGGHYREVRLQENHHLAYASTGLVFTGARIDSLRYDGSGASFINCVIGSIYDPPDVNGDVYAGPLMIDTLRLSKNLIDDERFIDVGASDTKSYWAIYASGVSAPWTSSTNDSTDGRYVTTNPAKAAGVVALVNRNKIPVTAGESLLVFSRARVDSTATTTQSWRNVRLSWYDAGGTLLSTTGIITCRCPTISVSPWCNDVAVVVVPANATGVTIQCGAVSLNNVSTDQSAVGLFRYKLLNTVGNMNAVLGALSAPSTKTTLPPRTAAPSGANNYAGFYVGDRVVNSTPTVGQPKAWVCTAAGTGGAAGTWVSEGNL